MCRPDGRCSQVSLPGIEIRNHQLTPNARFRLGMWGWCMQDSPLGVRLTDNNSAFPAGVNVAATWNKQLAYQRGQAMGEEHRGKGVDVQLGPVAGPLGKYPDGGRVWEGFSPDPVLTGVMMAETIKGIQDAGVIACAKHYILNEQEHFRQAGEAQGYGYTITQSISSNVDDKTMHELYLWPFVDAVRGKLIFLELLNWNYALT